MKVVFWGSSDFSVPSLEKLYEKHKVLAVVTNPDTLYGRGMKEVKFTPVKEFALKHNIDVIQPVSLKDRDFQEKLFSYDAEIYVVVSYGMIIPENIIYHPRYKSINLHASLLPKYRGASPIHHALINGDKITGNSIQFITKELDKGDILLQSRVEIGSDETYSELSERLAIDGADLLIKAIGIISTGNFRTTPQDENLASYTHIIKKEDGKINFVDFGAEEIYNRWRAFKKWPGIFTYYKNSKERDVSTEGIKTILTEVKAFDISGEKGRILKADRSGFVVACKKGCIQIERIKPENKNEMDFLSFINGYRPVAGNFF
ncbi:MAG: methionyl-tRNA formyltransferase [Brevinematia bacterium]